jgi:nicotinate-nucleotide adenylyltransferase
VRRSGIGIFGGTFDPIHVGHLSVAQQVTGRLGLTEMILVPAGRPPHKNQRAFASAADRLAMVALAIGGLARLSVSDCEIRRAGPSYTLDTVREIRTQRGAGHDYWFLIGADTVGELPGWHRIADILKEVSFAVAARPGFPPAFEPVEKRLGEKAGSLLRKAVVEVDPCDVSSTYIRRRIAAGEDISGLVRTAVADYIFSKGLYRGRG